MTNNAASARVAIYVRVSTLYQVDKDSLPMQKQDLLSYAKLMLNTEDCMIFEDAGYSGKNMDRPKFQKPSGLCFHVCRTQRTWRYLCQ